jgi:hypothetical protein
MKKFLLIPAVLLLFACSLFFPASRELNQNREKWEAMDIHHYRFNLRIGCFCPFNEQMPLTIEVKDGEAISITASNGQDIAPNLETYMKSASVEALFDIIQSAMKSGADDIKVTYDDHYGFPTSINIDNIKMAVDDEIGYYVENFEVLDP